MTEPRVTLRLLHFRTWALNHICYMMSFFMVLISFLGWEARSWAELDGILFEKMWNGHPERALVNIALGSGDRAIPTEPWVPLASHVEQQHGQVAENVCRDPQHTLQTHPDRHREGEDFHFLSTRTRVWGFRACVVRLGNKGRITVNLEGSRVCVMDFSFFFSFPSHSFPPLCSLLSFINSIYFAWSEK